MTVLTYLIPLCASVIQIKMPNTIITMYYTIPCMWQRKRDGEVRCILVIMWSAASPQARHAYAHNKKNIVLQYCFRAVVLGE